MKLGVEQRVMNVGRVLIIGISTMTGVRRWVGRRGVSASADRGTEKRRWEVRGSGWQRNAEAKVRALLG